MSEEKEIYKVVFLDHNTLESGDIRKVEVLSTPPKITVFGEKINETRKSLYIRTVSIGEESERFLEDISDISIRTGQTWQILKSAIIEKVRLIERKKR